QSRVTGFVLRSNFSRPRSAEGFAKAMQAGSLNTTACVSRWNITPLPGEIIDDLPGVGFPKWRVELSRIRNGRSGIWDIAWMNGKFEYLPAYKVHRPSRKTPAFSKTSSVEIFHS